MIADLGIESGTGPVRESPDRRTLYWTGSEGLRSAPLGEDGLASGTPKIIDAEALRQGFSVLGDAEAHQVYYCTRQNEIKRYNTATGNSVTLRRLDDPIDTGCSASPDGRWLIYDRRVRSGFDLKLLESVD